MPARHTTHSNDLPPTPGTYALLIDVGEPITIQIGRPGRFTLQPGHYLYVGSALGPGGLRARVGRHLRQHKRPHWHIDALTAAAPVTAIWAVESTTRLECTWANALRDLPGVSAPVPGFGASDCGCEAHLLRVPDPQAVQPCLSTTTSARVLLY